MFHVKKVGLLIGVAVVLLSAVLPPAAAHAQSAGQTTRPPLSLTTSPIPLSVITKPGQTVTADLRVKNNSTKMEKLKIELLKFGANGESGNPQLKERGPKDTYFDWVSFSETTFNADPNVWKTIKMTIKTPPDAAFGYYIAVLFSRASPEKPTGGASGVEGGVASLVLLDVEAPGAKREAKVLSFTATRKVYEFLPAKLNIRIRNSGNVHVAPTGSIFIKRGGAQQAVFDFNTQRGNILPATNRAFTEEWNDGFPAYSEKEVGNKTVSTLKWDFSKIQKLRFGRYTATLVAVYDDGQRDIPVEATVSFWVIPWRILGGLLLVLILVGAGMWNTLRSVWRKIRRKPKPSGGDSGGSTDTSKPAVAETPAEPEKVAEVEKSEPPTSPPVAKTAPPIKPKPVAKPRKPASDKPEEPQQPTTAPEIPD